MIHNYIFGVIIMSFHIYRPNFIFQISFDGNFRVDNTLDEDMVILFNPRETGNYRAFNLFMNGTDPTLIGKVIIETIDEIINEKNQ